MTDMKHNVYLYCGSIYDVHGCIVENPAVLLDKKTGTVHGWGDVKNVSARFEHMAAAYTQAGMPGMAGDLVMLDLSTYGGLTREQQCYILRRAVEYTATHFQKALCGYASAPEKHFRAWLQREMQQLPLDLSEQ